LATWELHGRSGGSQCASLLADVGNASWLDPSVDGSARSVTAIEPPMLILPAGPRPSLAWLALVHPVIDESVDRRFDRCGRHSLTRVVLGAVADAFIIVGQQVEPKFVEAVMELLPGKR
jgi:hypothetical protein